MQQIAPEQIELIEKSFSCDLYSKGYGTLSNLNDHKKKITFGTHCAAKHSWNFSLQRHINRHHASEPLVNTRETEYYDDTGIDQLDDAAKNYLIKRLKMENESQNKEIAELKQHVISLEEQVGVHQSSRLRATGNDMSNQSESNPLQTDQLPQKQKGSHYSRRVHAMGSSVPSRTDLNAERNQNSVAQVQIQSNTEQEESFDRLTISRQK